MGKGETIPKTIPRPSDELVDAWKPTFEPALDFGEWARSTFIEERGTLYNKDHHVLEHAEIGFLWTNVEFLRKGRRILGEARLGEPSKSNPWLHGRQRQQIRDWFGQIPDFLVTLDAGFIRNGDNAAVCAVIEHELYHCRIQVDKYGAPQYTADGFPRWGIAPHDVEEFVGVVGRYGAEATDTEALVRAANAGPSLARVEIDGVCGSCMRKVA